jgi:hypothetical protein
MAVDVKNDRVADWYKKRGALPLIDTPALRSAACSVSIPVANKDALSIKGAPHTQPDREPRY